MVMETNLQFTLTKDPEPKKTCTYVDGGKNCAYRGTLHKSLPYPIFTKAAVPLAFYDSRTRHYKYSGTFG